MASASSIGVQAQIRTLRTATADRSITAAPSTWETGYLRLGRGQELSLAFFSDGASIN